MAFVALLAMILMAFSFVGILTPLPKRMLPTRKRAAAVLLGAFVVFGVAGAQLPDSTTGQAAGRSSGEVSASESGASWPFTIASGTLRCDVDGARKYVTLDTGDGIQYALNGTAKTFGFPSADSIIKTTTLYAATPLLTVPEPQRRQLFAGLVRCEDTGKTSAACRKEASDSAGLTLKDIDQIALEGGAHGWEPLTPVKMSTQEFIDRGLALCAK